MGNIYSYLKWRGDLVCSERPFCEVDNWVLSELSYMDLTGIVPSVEESGSVTVEEATSQSRQQIKQSLTFRSERTPIISYMADTNRFRDVMLSNYVDVSNKETQAQFVALHIELDIASGIVLLMLSVIPILLRRMEFTPYAGIAVVCILLYGISEIAFSM